MINEEKVILMTKMAAYDKREGRDNMRVGRYFRSDYVAFQILKAFFSVTIAYVLILALYIVYDFERLMQEIYQIDLIGFAKNILLYYLVTVAVYGALTYIVYTYRYVKAKKGLKLYYKNLKKLNSMYKEG